MVMDPTASKSPAKRKALTSRAMKFADLIAAGKTNSDAYKEAYHRPHLLPADAANRAAKVLLHPGVKARVEWLRHRSDAKVLLTLNDRLTLLAADAQAPALTAAERNARARSIEVYTKIAGGFAPETHKVELTGADGGPVEVTAAVQMSSVPLRQRFEALRRAKAERNETHH